jgi:hypothetical protein
MFRLNTSPHPDLAVASHDCHERGRERSSILGHRESADARPAFASKLTIRVPAELERRPTPRSRFTAATTSCRGPRSNRPLAAIWLAFGRPQMNLPASAVFGPERAPTEFKVAGWNTIHADAIARRESTPAESSGTLMALSVEFRKSLSPASSSVSTPQISCRRKAG